MKESTREKESITNLSKGVMLNAYPNSIGAHLNDIVTLLKMPEFKNAF